MYPTVKILPTLPNNFTVERNTRVPPVIIEDICDRCYNAKPAGNCDNAMNGLTMVLIVIAKSCLCSKLFFTSHEKTLVVAIDMKLETWKLKKKTCSIYTT